MRLWNTFLKGLAAVLPVTLTLYLVYWLGNKAESFLGGLLELVLPQGWYRPGLGLLVGFAVVLATGVLVNAYVVRRVLRFGESLLARIPVVKTIFSTFQDITRFLPADKRRDLQRVVLWRLATARLIGFVTEEHVSTRVAGDESTNLVAVYFPMSYQLGGYTLYLPRAELEPTQLTVEEGMRLALIGGISHAPAIKAEGK